MFITFEWTIKIMCMELHEKFSKKEKIKHANKSKALSKFYTLHLSQKYSCKILCSRFFSFLFAQIFEIVWIVRALQSSSSNHWNILSFCAELFLTPHSVRQSLSLTLFTCSFSWSLSLSFLSLKPLYNTIVWMHYTLVCCGAINVKSHFHFRFED